MATKIIDHIQSEQIVKLEEDVNILKNALNLMIGDINTLAPKLTPIISNLNAIASSIDNNYISLNVSILKSQDSGNHTDGTYTNVSLGGGSGTGAKATVVIGSTSGSYAGGGIQSVTITTAGTNYLVGNTLSIPTSVTGGSSPGAVKVVGDGTSVDGILKKLTEFDDRYTEHISRKFPPVVDIQGVVHVGYHVGGTPLEHAHPEGWIGSDGTCLTATASINPNYTYNWTPGGWSNVRMVPLSTTRPDVPTNQTWEGLQLWAEMPTALLQVTGTTLFTICNIWHGVPTITMPDTAGLAVGQEVYGLENNPLPYIASISSGISVELNRNNAAGSGAYHSDNLHFNPIITNVDFRLEIFANNAPGHKNCSYGFGKSVGDEMMSSYGTMQSGVWQSGFFATVTSVGSQLETKPNDNTPTYRSPHAYLSAYDPLGYGDDSPGVGGPTEPADWGEGGSHHVMDPSNQLDDQQYITHVLNTGVVPSYLSQEQILFMSDEDKVKRAKKLTRMTLNRLRDAGIWKTTKDVSDGVLTADDFIT